MKTTLYIFSILFFWVTGLVNAQTTVTANSIDISDNLDLRAVATLFGESRDLADFEKRLNDPSIQISNLDLNNDNQVDYLRVVEIVEGSVHLIIIQAVLGRDLYQDVATIEVERTQNQQARIQIVGNSYFYGPNYIYEPVYVHHPVIFTYFWRPNYAVYYSPWYWNYYPTYFVAWRPFPIFWYRNHVNVYVNVNNVCYYTPYGRNNRAVALYQGRRSYAYETRHPGRSFQARNNGVANRHQLVNHRNTSHDRTSGIVNGRTSTATNGLNRNAITQQSRSNSTAQNRGNSSMSSRANISGNATTSRQNISGSQQNTVNRNANINSGNRNVTSNNRSSVSGTTQRNTATERSSYIAANNTSNRTPVNTRPAQTNRVQNSTGSRSQSAVRTSAPVRSQSAPSRSSTSSGRGSGRG